MLVSLEWLAEYVDWPWDAEELAARLTLSGVAVEQIIQPNPGIDGVVAGRIVSVEKHPQADRLLVAKVDIGGGKTLTVCTGAPNAEQGRLVAVAPPGATLPRGWRIEAVTMQGIVSEGMLLSEAELLEGKSHKDLSPEEQAVAAAAGLWLLPEEIGPGRPIRPGDDMAAVLGLHDTVLELDLTPNYASHCLSMLGVAREVAALTGGRVRLPNATPPAPTHDAGPVDVRIEVPDLCPRYSAHIVTDVKPGPSPLWMQNRLRTAGMRPISNVVDVTNYVMLETGQPLHAFDADTITDRTIVVRRARDGERLVTLDEQQRTLTGDMLVIADPERAVGLAGVMGGLETEVTDGTRTLLLESAHFDNRTIRRTAQRLGLHSEASARFTKGTDVNAVVWVAERTLTLLAELGAAQPATAHVDAYPAPRAPGVVWLRPERCNSWTGLSLTAAEMRDCLQRLELPALSASEADDDAAVAAAIAQAVPQPPGEAAAAYAAAVAEAVAKARQQRQSGAASADDLLVILPTRRPDLATEIDLTEEVARVWGYERLPATLPDGEQTAGDPGPWRARSIEASAYFRGVGLSEAVTYALVPSGLGDKLRLPADHPWRQAIRLASPLTEDQSELRTTALPGLLLALAHNYAHRERQVGLFELSSVYRPAQLPLTELPEERMHLALGLMGPWHDKTWHGPVEGADFFRLKGILDGYFRRIGVAVAWVPGSHPSFHPGRQAELQGPDGQHVGIAGELHPLVAEAFALPRGTLAAEVDWETLCKLADRRAVAYEPLPRFPAVTRDLAVVVDAEVPAARVEAEIVRAGGDLLRRVRLFDVYAGEQVGPGKKSLAYSLVFRSATRTLTDDEVDALHADIRAALAAVGAELRA